MIMKIGVMCSGNGTNFENIVTSCPEIDVVLMIYNKENCGAVKRANKLGIPSCHIKSKDEDFIIKYFKALKVDYIVLAGWMRILSSKFIQAFPDKIINIHPSLLPKYKGLDSIQRALDNGDEVTGCTVHMVTEELDSGKILMQEEVGIFPHDTIESVTKAVHKAEHRILPKVLRNLNISGE
jgi:formyltetrahydrofolate-dependent phosphoribosylglycinamide formyltransferase